MRLRAGCPSSGSACSGPVQGITSPEARCLFVRTGVLRRPGSIGTKSLLRARNYCTCDLWGRTPSGRVVLLWSHSTAVRGSGWAALALSRCLALGATTSFFCAQSHSFWVRIPVFSSLHRRWEVVGREEGQAASCTALAALKGLKALRTSTCPISRSRKVRGSQRHRCGMSARRRCRL